MATSNSSSEETPEEPPSCDHKHQYSSIFYHLPDNIGEKIEHWSRKNIPDSVLFQDAKDPSYGRELNSHCTILFGIHDPSPLTAIDRLRFETPFLIRLGKIDIFDSHQDFDVVKINVYSPDIHRLHDWLAKELTCTESYNFSPHVTIAYVRKGKGKQFQNDPSFDRLALRVNSLCFSSSTGFLCPIRLFSSKEIVYA